MSLSPEAARSHRKVARMLLDQMPKEITAKFRAEIEAGAETIANAARRFAPVDDGDLRDSIGHDVAPDGLSAVVYAGDVAVVANVGGKRQTRQLPGRPAFYSRMVEFGTVKMAAQPFFFPAYRMNKKRIQSRLSRALGKIIKARSAT